MGKPKSLPITISNVPKKMKFTIYSITIVRWCRGCLRSFIDKVLLRPKVILTKDERQVFLPSIIPMEAPNGVGLSPDEKTLYVAETPTGRLWAYSLSGAGEVDSSQRPAMMAQLPDYHMFDSLAVDADGNICVATLITGGITVHSPDGKDARLIPMPDILTTNICFGGEDLTIAYVTLSTTGKLVSCQWETAGLPLNFLN